MIPADFRVRLVRWYGEPVVSFVERAGVHVRPLRPDERFAQVSPLLATSNIDRWPVPPAGLFVVAERTVYLRSVSDMTLAHEFAHAFDLALGGTEYFTQTSRAWRALFASVTSFVTPYAASGLDEFFAESVRAYVEANDDKALWPRATRARLRATSSTLFDQIERTFRSIQ